MPNIVLRAGLAVAYAQGQTRLRAFQRLPLAFLITTQHQRFLWRMQLQPEHVPELGFKVRVGGELEGAA